MIFPGTNKEYLSYLEFIRPHYQISIQAITLVNLGKSVKF